MSRNGNGTYNLPAGNPVVTGTTISSTWANNTLADMANAITGSIAADGQTTITGPLKGPNGTVAFAGVGQTKIPSGTTAQRAASPTDGMIRYNTDIKQYEGYKDGAWSIFGNGAGGTLFSDTVTATQGQTVINTPTGFVPGGDNLSVYVNGSRQIYNVNYTETSATQITFTTGLNAGDLVNYTIGASTALSVNASSVLYNEGATNAVDRNVQSKLQESVSVKDFGAVGNGSTDDTLAIQNAIDYSITNHAELVFPSGYYSVSSVIVENANGLAIQGAGASLIGDGSTVFDAVLIIKNSVDVKINGLGVSASFSLNYSAGIKVWQEGAGSTGFNFFNDITIANAQVAWLFGDINEPDVVLSETTVTGGYTYACPIAAKAIGTQTVINFVGTMLMSSYGAGTGAWLALDSYVLYSIGAYIGVTSGEMLMVETTTWAGVKVNPIASPLLGNFYGNIYVQGVEFECASQYVVIENPLALTPIAPAAAECSVRFIGCNGYHAGNFASMVVVDSDYLGSIVFNSNNFYAGTSRTLGNINATGNTTCNIYCDAQSFGYNFVQGLVAIAGGIIHFDKRVITSVGDCNGEVLPLNTPTTLKWTAATNTEDTQRFTADYSSTTGLFTVPAGGLKSVTITAVVRSTQPTQPLSINVIANGSVVAYGSAGLSSFVRQTFDLGNIAAGVTLGIQATQGGIASVTNGGQYENMIISARN
jgi:hypothetical protein